MKYNLLNNFQKTWGNKKSFTFSALTLITGTTAAQIITVAAVPLLTRLYTPENFGVFTVYLSILSLLAPLMSGRYELAIPLTPTFKDAVELLVLCLAIVIGMTVFMSLGFWLLGDIIILKTNTPGLGQYLWIVPWCLFGMGIYQVFYGLALREKLFSIIARTKLIQSLGQVLIQLGLGFYHLGVLGLIVGDIFGKTAGSGSLIGRNWSNIKTTLAAISLPGIKGVAKQYNYFPIFTLGSTFLNTAGLQVPSLFLAAFYGAEVVGWFGLSQRLLGLPITLIGASLSQVYYTEVAQRLREQLPLVKPLYFKIMRLSLLIMIPIVVLALGSPWLFGIFFGKNWAEAGSYTIYLLPLYCFQVAFTVNNLLLVTGFNHWQLAWDATRLIAVVIVFGVAQKLNWPPSRTIFGYSIVMAILYIITLIMNLYVLRSLEKV